MPSAIKILPHYTYEDYCHWEGRWELIDGIPYAMSPAPAPRHQKISAKLMAVLINAIEKSGCKNCSVYNFIDIKVSEDTILQPDALVVCKEITKPYLDFPAALVVEILSPSTALKDRNSKFYIYEEQSISYYMIVDTEKMSIELYRLTKEGKYDPEEISSGKNFIFNFDADCSAEVALNKIWE